MTTRLVASLVFSTAMVAAPDAVRAQSGTPPLSGGRVTAQVLTGFVAMPIGFVAGGLGTRWVARRLGATDDHASSAAMIGAWTGAALATAAGAKIVGSHGHVTGSYPAAVAGTVTGGAVSWLLIRANQQQDDTDTRCRVRCVLSAVAVFTMPSIGATIGFNATRRYRH